MIDQKFAQGQLAMIALYRSYLGGSRLSSLAREYGVTDTAIRNRIEKFKQLVAHYARKFDWEPRIDWARNRAEILRDRTRDRSAMWLAYLEHYEVKLHEWIKDDEEIRAGWAVRAAERALANKLVFAPRTVEAVKVLTEEELAQAKQALLLQQIDWMRQTLNGVTVRELSQSAKVSNAKVKEGLDAVKQLVAQKGLLPRIYRNGDRLPDSKQAPQSWIAALNQLAATPH